MKRAVIVTLIGVSLNITSAFAWDSEDVKSIDEPQLMDDRELSSEAYGACISAAVAHKQGHPEYARPGEKYLETILRVARSKHSGEVPWWMKEYKAAAGWTDAGKCNDISMKRLQEDIAKAKEAETRKKATGTQKKRTP